MTQSVGFTDHAVRRLIERAWHRLPKPLRNVIRSACERSLAQEIQESSRLFLGPQVGGSKWLVIGEVGLYVVQKVPNGGGWRVVTVMDREETGIFDAVTGGRRMAQIREELIQVADGEDEGAVVSAAAR